MLKGTPLIDGMSVPPALEGTDAAALAAGDLLPGEDPTSDRIDDAVHWCRVYWGLLSSKATAHSDVRETIRVATGNLRAGARLDSALTVQERLLRSQTNRCRVRLAYWQARRLELSSTKPSRP